MKIEDFEEVRTDGKVIPEGMTVDAMLAKGWSAEKIVRARWRFGGSEVSVSSEHGLLSRVTPRRDGVVTIRCSGEGKSSTLAILNGVGSIRVVIHNHQKIDGRDHVGVFAWFEPSRVIAPNAFGAVFRTQGGATYQFDIDADDGRVLAAYETR